VSGRKTTPATSPKINSYSPVPGKRSPELTRWIEAKWSPTKLTVKPKNFTKCTKAKVAWTITNKTKKTQTIQAKVGSKKQTLGKLKAGQKAGLCVAGKKGAKGDFFIKGSKSKLVVTLS
jgi:hypothetical protein